MADMNTDTPADGSARVIKHKRPQISEDAVQLPWVDKYRPAKLEDLVAHEDIVSILTRLIDNDNLPHLLLYGPPGTGKVCVWYYVYYNCSFVVYCIQLLLTISLFVPPTHIL